MKRRKSMRTISLLMIWVVLCALGCQRTSERTVFYPIDDTKAYYITYKQDSILIYARPLGTTIWRSAYEFYKLGDDYYYDVYKQDEEKKLVMSRSIAKDSIYSHERPSLYKIVIENRGDTLFASSIFRPNVVQEYRLSLRIIYDKDYHIKSVQDWTIWETYAPFVNGVQDTFVVKPNMIW